jgi:hypothetical protein
MLSKFISHFSKKFEPKYYNNNDNKQYKDLDEIIIDNYNTNYHIIIDIKPPIIIYNNDYIEDYKQIYLNRYHKKLIMK